MATLRLICYTPAMTQALKLLRKKTEHLRKRGKASAGRLLAQAWMDLDAAHMAFEEDQTQGRMRRAERAQHSFDALVHQFASQKGLDAALLECSNAVKAGLEEESAMQLLRDAFSACCHAERSNKKERSTVHLFSMAVHGEHNELACLHESGAERLPSNAGLIDPASPILILGTWPLMQATQWLMDPQTLFLVSNGCLTGLIEHDPETAIEVSSQALGAPSVPEKAREGHMGSQLILGAYLEQCNISERRMSSAFETTDIDAWRKTLEEWQTARGEVTFLMGAPKPLWEGVSEAIAWEIFQGMNLARLMDDPLAIENGVHLKGVCIAVDPMAIPGAQTDQPARTIGLFSDGSRLEKAFFRDSMGFLLTDVAVCLEEGMGVALEISTYANLEATLEEMKTSLNLRAQ